MFSLDYSGKASFPNNSVEYIKNRTLLRLNATNVTQLTEIAPLCLLNTYANDFAGILITHVSLTLALIGIAVNLLTLIVLNRSGTRGATDFLLFALATEDILIIVSYSLYYVAIHYYEIHNFTYLGLLRYIDSPLYFVLNWVKVAEIYTIVLLSLQRYSAIRWPLRAASLCSVGRTKRILLVVIILSALVKLPNLILGYRVMVLDTFCDQYVLKDVFEDQPWYTNFQLIHVQLLDQVISYITPLTVLIVLNIGLILRVHGATKKRLRETCSRRVRRRNQSSIPSDSIQLSENPEQRISQLRHKQLPRLNTLFTSRSSSLHNPSRIDKLKSEEISPSVSRTYIASTPNLTPSNTQSRNVTLTLIGVVSTFIIFETPTTICICYEFWQLITKTMSGGKRELDEFDQGASNYTSDRGATTTQFYRYAYPAALICVMVGCASNFFVYMLIGSKFRRLCFKVLGEMTTPVFWRFGCCTEETDGRNGSRKVSRRPRYFLNRSNNSITGVECTATQMALSERGT